MGRSVPFEPDLVCDVCGEVGAFEIMGDYLCSECLDIDIDEEGEEWGEGEEE